MCCQAQREIEKQQKKDEAAREKERKKQEREAAKEQQRCITSLRLLRKLDAMTWQASEEERESIAEARERRICTEGKSVLGSSELVSVHRCTNT